MTAPVTASNVALVDLSYVFEHHPAFKPELEAIKRQVEAFEQDAQRQQKQIDGQRKQLAAYRAGTAEYRRLDEATTKQLAELKVQIALKRKDIMEQEAQVFYRTYQDVVRVVQSIAEARGYDLVLRFERDRQDQGSVGSDPQQTIKLVNRPVVFQQQLDISQLVLQELHRMRTTQAPATGQRLR